MTKAVTVAPRGGGHFSLSAFSAQKAYILLIDIHYMMPFGTPKSRTDPKSSWLPLLPVPSV